MAQYDDEDGVWRTIGGRRVFIKKGQSLSEAMIASGKFKNLREDYRKAKQQDEEIDNNKALTDEAKRLAKGEYKTKEEEEMFEKAKKETDELLAQSKVREEIKTKQDAVNKSFEENQRLEIAKDIAKEVYGLNENNATPERIEREARKILEPIDGEVLEKGDTPYTNSKGQLERSTKSLEEWRDSLKKDADNKTTFTQHLDMHGGEIEYDAQRLKEMEAHGTKPMEHSYTGGGWEGLKYDSNLSTKEIAKNLTDYSKKEFPDVKLSRKTDYNGIDMYIMNSDKDMFVSDKDIDNMNFSDLEQVSRSNGFNWWAKDNVKDYNTNRSYSIDDLRKYAKETLNNTRKHDSNVAGDEWYLSDYGKKVVSGLNKEMNSYNYDDSDGMVDYFDTNFYGYVHIGKWDKPYEVKETTTNSKMNDTIRQKAFQKYKKEHPGTEKTLEDFI